MEGLGVGGERSREPPAPFLGALGRALRRHSRFWCAAVLPQPPSPWREPQPLKATPNPQPPVEAAFCRG